MYKKITAYHNCILKAQSCNAAENECANNKHIPSSTKVQTFIYILTKSITYGKEFLIETIGVKLAHI